MAWANAASTTEDLEESRVILDRHGLSTLALAREMSVTLDQMWSRSDGSSASISIRSASTIDPSIRMLETALRLRKARDKVLSRALLGEPGWDMLLTLATLRSGDKGLPITSLCFAVDVPVSSGLRWVSRLENAGLVQRHQDQEDKRRSIVSLSEEGRKRMRLWCSKIV